MTNAEIKALALDQGCTPVYSNLYNGFCCMCADNRHGISEECSLITEGSLLNRHERLHERVRDLLMPAPALASRLTEAGAIDLVRVSDAKKGSALVRAALRWGAARLYLCKE